MSWCLKYFCAVGALCMFANFLVKVTEWPPIGKIAAHSAYEMFSWYKYLIVSLVFSHLGFWSGSLFLIAHFPDLCLLVLFPNRSDTNRRVRQRGWLEACIFRFKKKRKYNIHAQVVQSPFLLNQKLSSVTVHVGLCQTWSKISKTSFLASRLKCKINVDLLDLESEK